MSDQVLKYMGKPSHSVYQQFLRNMMRQTGKQESSSMLSCISCPPHPGCTMKEAVKLAEYVRDLGFTPEQVQDFYPTPSTLSTCMYYTGIHPLTGEKVYVPKNPHEKAIQRALMQYKNPANRELVLEGLKMTGRMDLVGYGPKCLIRPLKRIMEANSILRAVVGMRKTAEIAKITKTVQHLQRRILSEIYIRKIPEEDVSDRKRKTEIKKQSKAKTSSKSIQRELRIFQK